MVFEALNPSGQSYLLWHRFRMPNDHGSKDAVAVSEGTASELLSAYTFLLEHIVLLVWGIILVGTLLIATKRCQSTHPNYKMYSDIWHKRTNPYDILKLSIKQLFMLRANRFLVIPWVFLALAFVVVKYAVPIIFAKYIMIGSAAPVNPEVIFLPSLNGTSPEDPDRNLRLLQNYEIEVPRALRAAGGVDGANDTGKADPPAKVDPPIILQTLENDEVVMRYNYHYKVTGLDLGLQNQAELTLHVEGSCVTDYTWYNISRSDDTWFDDYIWFNDLENINAPLNVKSVSVFDGGPPLAYFAGLPPADASSTNSSWGAIISSVNRTSFFPGTDPWYRTGLNPNHLADPTDENIATNMVLPKRPALSCWEDSAWEWHGQKSSTSKLYAMPGLNLPDGLQVILSYMLSEPMIMQLGGYLRVSGLKSSFTSLDGNFNANTSSIYNDLQRLVYASYIATVNALSETTLYPQGGQVLNDVRPGNILMPGTADFVVFGNGVEALSVKALIIIPTLTMLLWIVFILLMLVPNIASMVTKLKEKRDQDSGDEEKGKGKGTVVAAKVSDESIPRQGEEGRTEPEVNKGDKKPDGVPKKTGEPNVVQDDKTAQDKRPNSAPKKTDEPNVAQDDKVEQDKKPDDVPKKTDEPNVVQDDKVEQDKKPEPKKKHEDGEEIEETERGESYAGPLLLKIADIVAETILNDDDATSP